MMIRINLLRMMALAVLLRPSFGATSTSEDSGTTGASEDSSEALTKSGNLRGEVDDESILRQEEVPECLEEYVLYENPDEADPDAYDSVLKQSVAVDEFLYQDENFEEPVGTYNAICHGLDEGVAFCNVFYESETLGVGALTGVMELLEEPTEDGVIGTGEYVFTGGANKGKITSLYTEDISTHTVCIQE